MGPADGGNTLRRLLFWTLLAAWLVALCVIPALCCAAAPDDAGCYPDEVEHAHPAAAPVERPAGGIERPRRGAGALYQAAVVWLRNLIGSLTHRSSSKFDLERNSARRESGLVPTFRADLRKGRVQVGLRLRF
jgi:hypothetical protein